MGWFGASIKRKEDPDLLTGAGRYVDDIKLPGMLHAVVLRSPHAHAGIRGIDKRAALALPGVHAVFTFADLPPSWPRTAVIWPRTRPRWSRSISSRCRQRPIASRRWRPARRSPIGTRLQ